MPKQILTDMVPVKNRRPREIKELSRVVAEEYKEEPSIKSVPIIERKIPRETIAVPRYENEKKKPRYLLWFLALVSVLVCFFAVSFLFSKAEVLVDPKKQDVVLNEHLAASKDASGQTLSFDSVSISGNKSKTLQASGEKDSVTPATGTVILYNAYNTSPQLLSIDTRLEGSNGKIYKTLTKTIVPGATKAGTPGSATVKIYGAEKGSAYNSGPLDFKIFGFKGTPKYTKFYARSKGDITGGFTGKVPVISDADKISALADLQTSLQSDLLQKATDQTPSGFILFKNAVFLNTNDVDNQPNISSTYNQDNSVTYTLTGTLYGILFSEEKLTKTIAKDNIDKYDGSPVYIPDIRSLDFSLASKDSTSFDNVKNIDFNLSGKTKVVYKLDTDKFIADLVGSSKKDFNKVLSQYPNIDSATLTVSPIWRMSVPANAKDIKITIDNS